MPADDKSKDPATSPAPAPTPSNGAQPTPAATPEPTQAGGAAAASPTASGKESAPPAPSKDETPGKPGSKGTPSTPDGIVPMGDGDVLDRLTAPTEEKKAPTPAAPEGSAAAKPADGAPAEGEDKENPKTPDESAETPFQDATEEELAGYHSRTRHRIRGFQKQLDQARPFATFAQNLLNEAAQHGVSPKSVISWQQLGLGLRARDPEAIDALSDVLQSYGVKIGASEPVQPMPPDFSKLDLLLAELAGGQDINEHARAKIQAVLDPLRKPAAPEAPAAPAAPRPAQPQQRQPAPQAPQAQTPMQQTVAWVHKAEQSYAQRVGQQAWPEVRKAIYAEATRREQGLPIEVVNDPVELRVRFAACAEHVLAKRAAAAKPPAAAPVVQPSLRANTSASPAISVPKIGTPEYDDWVMTHGVPTR